MLDRKIKDAVLQLAGTRFLEEIYVIPATVTAVNIPARTCDVIPIVGKSDTPITGVKLMAEVEDGLLRVPVVNSTVFIGYSRTTPAFVIQFSAIDYVMWWVGGSSIEIKNDGTVNINSTQYPGTLTINGGQNGGVAVTSSIVTKLNNLESKVNALLNAFNSHVHTGVQTGAGSSGTTATPVTGTLTPTQQSDLENTKVKH